MSADIVDLFPTQRPGRRRPAADAIVAVTTPVANPIAFAGTGGGDTWLAGRAGTHRPRAAELGTTWPAGVNTTGPLRSAAILASILSRRSSEAFQPSSSDRASYRRLCLHQANGRTARAPQTGDRTA